MKSIILTSHGELCKGLVNSAKMIFGSDLKQVEYLTNLKVISTVSKNANDIELLKSLFV